MASAHKQTKNAQIDNHVVSASSTVPVEYGSIVNYNGTEEYSVSGHGASGSPAGVVVSRNLNNAAFKAGDCVDVQTTGIAKVKVGAAVTKGQAVASDANGTLQPHTPGTTAKVGVALFSAPVGAYVPVRLDEQS